MRKYIVIAVLIVIGFSAQARSVNDTIPYWHINYGKTVILRGNLTSSPGRHELTIRSGAVKDLTVSFVFENQPHTSSLVIKEKNEVLRTIDHDPVMGSYFVVPVRELISTHQPDVRYELDFYYTRNQENEHKLATIIFIFK
jgi:hypothetical protein